jgi:hypothetical protein
VNGVPVVGAYERILHGWPFDLFEVTTLHGHCRPRLDTKRDRGHEGAVVCPGIVEELDAGLNTGEVNVVEAAPTVLPDGSRGRDVAAIR